jgi:hypothetical protein
VLCFKITFSEFGTNARGCLVEVSDSNALGFTWKNSLLYSRILAQQIVSFHISQSKNIIIRVYVCSVVYLLQGFSLYVQLEILIGERIQNARPRTSSTLPSTGGLLYTSQILKIARVGARPYPLLD